jgi:hypothetical protein
MVELVERHADGEVTWDSIASRHDMYDYFTHRTEEEREQLGIGRTQPSSDRSAVFFLCHTTMLRERTMRGLSHVSAWNHAHHLPELQPCRVVRCLMPNPFRPVPPDPARLTSTAVSLAEGIYHDRAFDRLPILADALQDAGCENADILAHCRGPGPHVRGCWVVDLVLGKG